MKRILFSLILMASSLSSAADFEVRLKENLLNRFTDLMGTKSFTGSVQVGPVSKNYTVTVKDLEIFARNSGLGYEATLKIQFMGLTHYLDVEGGVNASITNSRLTFELASLNFPVRIEVPGVGEVRLFTIQTSLSQKMTWRFHPAIDLSIQQTLVHGRLRDLQIQSVDQALVIRGNLLFQ